MPCREPEVKPVEEGEIMPEVTEPRVGAPAIFTLEMTRTKIEPKTLKPPTAEEEALPRATDEQ